MWGWIFLKIAWLRGVGFDKWKWVMKFSKFAIGGPLLFIAKELGGIFSSQALPSKQNESNRIFWDVIYFKLV